jgi:serine/threonine-protein kinase
MLLEELLRVELEYRRKGDEKPTAMEYLLRFPEDAEVIDLVFAVADHDATVTFTVVGEDGRAQPGISPEGLDRLKNLFCPGVVLEDRYTLVNELGHGGMGRVYMGHDRRLGDRPVAVKVILPDNRRGMITEAQMRCNFEDEARIGANLVHSMIATVYDYGVHEGVPFTVFEYIPGETLRDLLCRRGRLPLEEVKLIIAPIAQALDFAHSRHVVHRDLKPENIRATEQGAFKILDLGLAKEFRRAVDWAGFCGTPAYASPEQAQGLPCDGRTDQYALSLIVFEMLTGRRVFEDKDWKILLEKHRSQEPRLTHGLGTHLPESVLAALSRALQKDPNRRFATCE